MQKLWLDTHICDMKNFLSSFFSFLVLVGKGSFGIMYPCDVIKDKKECLTYRCSAMKNLKILFHSTTMEEPEIKVFMALFLERA